MPLTFGLDLHKAKLNHRAWQISGSEVISFKSYCPTNAYTHTHTDRLLFLDHCSGR